MPDIETTDVLHDAAYWLESMLQNWARWMRSDERPEGLPAEASGGAVGYTHTGDGQDDSDAAYHKLDVVLAEKTNAAIEGLPLLEQMAIYTYCDISTTWRAESDPDALERAKLSLTASLLRRDVWLGA